MKTLFTIKDFLLYNSPCFSCRRKTIFEVLFTDKDNIDHFLRPKLQRDGVEIDLHIKYVSTLKIHLNYTTHKITISDPNLLTEYLADRKFYFSLNCPHCHTWVNTQVLQFDLNKKMLRPFTLDREVIWVREKGYKHELITYFKQDTTELISYKMEPNPSKKRVNALHVPVGDPFRINLPLLPISKIQNKKHLLSKIHTYLLFS